MPDDPTTNPPDAQSRLAQAGQRLRDLQKKLKGLKTDPAGYAAHRDAAGKRQAALSRSGRDIGPVPDIADVRRRGRCRNSLRRFCETYNPESFYLGWSADQLKCIARIEEAITAGALFAFAMPRGGGKTTICRMAILWAVSYAHCRYGFLIGATASKARDSLDAVKTFVRFLPLYAADFPEISYPIGQIAGIAQRANGQLSDGDPTLVEWTQDRIVLPTVKVPANWPKRWSQRGGRAPTSGTLIGVSGLTGDGIRGSLHTLVTGEQVRPDFVLLDDPQTDESAGSDSQNETRERLIAGAVLGMAGPDTKLGAVMPCTIIRADDMAARLLDRKKHPLWRGERTQMLVTLPTNMEAWETYFDVYQRCAEKEPPAFAEANDYYRQHQALLDAGAEASWSERKLPTATSAIESAMQLYFFDPIVFFAEYQNDPQDADADTEDLPTAEEITLKVHTLARRQVPLYCNHVVAFVDVSKHLLWWTVAGFADDFTGAILDYGAWPEQKRPYYTLRNASPKLFNVYKKGGFEGRLYAGLRDLSDKLLRTTWPREDGAAMHVERCLIDANYGDSKETVYQFCRESTEAARLTPSHGKYFGPGTKPLDEYQKRPGAKLGHRWYMPGVSRSKGIRHCIIDTNYWKSFGLHRFKQPHGSKGSLCLFAAKPQFHRMFADQVSAEKRVRVKEKDRTMDLWKEKPDQPDNHFFDCLVGVCVAASLVGCELDAAKQARSKLTGRKKLSEIREAKRRQRAA